MKPIKGRLRDASLEEAERVLTFYRANPHKFLLPRPESEFRKAIARGNFLVVEIGERLVAASGIFDYSDGTPYVELAETAVSTEVQGHGLQALFFRQRIATVVVSQGPSVTITTAVDPRNVKSAENARQAGFQPWPQPVPEAYVSCPLCPNRPAASAGRKCCCDFFCLPVEKAREAVSTALRESESGVLTLTRKTPGLLLSSECYFVTGVFRGMLREFADGGTW
jgi:hypothetical protein